MFSVITCIRDNHDWRLVLAAAAVCLVGAMAAMLLLSRAQECDAGRRKLWIGASAFAFGTGVWATHFIAMLAYDGGMPIGYQLGLTTLSFLLSVVGSWAAILVASESRGRFSLHPRRRPDGARHRLHAPDRHAGDRNAGGNPL